MSELKESSIVTVLAVIGLVFGLLGMLGSFIPVLGVFAVFISFPSAIVSLLGLIISYLQGAKKTFIITSFTICLIGLGVSFSQYALIVAYNESRKESSEPVSPTSLSKPMSSKETNSTKELNQYERIIENLKKNQSNKSDDNKGKITDLGKAESSENPFLEILNQAKEIDNQLERSQRKAVEDFNRSVLEYNENNKRIIENTVKQMKELENQYQN